jgi:molybdopterin molybdotransferase
MAQLSDDCFAFGGPMMSVDEAVGLIGARVTPVREIETVALAEADGRILARHISAPLPLPPFTNSAVDGYAVRARDLPSGAEATFGVTGRIQAGAAAGEAIKAGHATRIFTGAPMPEGADTVFMQEDVRLDETGRVILPAGLKPGANVRPAGEDIPVGHSALPAGRRLRPQDVALIAAFGLTQVDVTRRIRVAVFSTGNELVSPGAPRADAQLFDSNRFMLMAMLARLGCEVSDLGIVRDDRAALAEGLKKVAGSHDLILTTGGVSTGEEDHVKASVESAGSLVLWRMAIKPGRPVAMGIIGGTPFIGLPGNPVASFVTFVHVVRPTVLALAGGKPQPVVAMPVRAAFSYRKKIARREYVRANLREASDGVLEATKFPREGAGLLSSLVDTDGLVELGEAVTQVEPGQTVGFLSYASLI